MVKLVEAEQTSVDDVCLELVKNYYGWILLNENQIRSIATSLGEGKNTLWNKTFILPGYLVDARRYMSKLNTLVSYIAVQLRKRNCTLIVVAPNLKSIDKRLRNLIECDKELNWKTQKE